MKPTERASAAACGCRYLQTFTTNSRRVAVVDIERGGGITCLVFWVRNGESEMKSSVLQKDVALLAAGSKQVRTAHTHTRMDQGSVPH